MITPPAAAASGRLATDPPDARGVDVGIVLDVTDADCVVEDEVMVPPSDVVGVTVVLGLPVLEAVIAALSESWPERVETPVAIVFWIEVATPVSGV